MDDSPVLPKIEEQVLDLLRRRGGIAAAYLLGSAASGRLRADSDIDIALLPWGERTISLEDRLAFAAELTSLVGRTVDAGVMTPGDLVYAAEAILKGRRIATLDKEYAAMMETRLLGCYLQFKEDRREVEDAYRAA